VNLLKLKLGILGIFGTLGCFIEGILKDGALGIATSLEPEIDGTLIFGMLGMIPMGFY